MPTFKRQGTILDICRQVRISDYLTKKGVSLIPVGKKYKCKCPIPAHKNDNTPSFYISTNTEGEELFKCFGCEEGGNIITITRLMEGGTNKEIVRKLANSLDMALSPYEFGKGDPQGADILKVFCTEDILALQIYEYTFNFLEANRGRADALDKVNRFYRVLDDMLARGDGEGMKRAFRMFRQAAISYKGKRNAGCDPTIRRNEKV